MNKRTTCSTPSCENPRRNNGKQRYCVECHATWMRANRKPARDFSAEQKKKSHARTIANRAKNDGKLIPQPCKCGSTDVEMHHENYDYPLLVTWICRVCHLEHHKKQDMVKKVATCAA